jgi:hypothetical protein
MDLPQKPSAAPTTTVDGAPVTHPGSAPPATAAPTHAGVVPGDRIDTPSTSADPAPVSGPAVAQAGGAHADSPDWVQSACQGLVDRMPSQMSQTLTPDRCEEISVNIAANLVWEIPAIAVAFIVALWKLWRWVRHCPGRAAGTDSPTRPQSPSLAPETLGRLHDLLLALPRWTEQSRARQNFVTIALGKGHPLLSLIDWSGSARDVARSVVTVCLEHQGTEGTPPLCMLLACIPREYGPKPDRDRELTALSARLGCP